MLNYEIPNGPGIYYFMALRAKRSLNIHVGIGIGYEGNTNVVNPEARVMARGQ